MTMYGCNFDHTKPFSDTCAQFALAAGVAQTYTVPGNNSQKYRLKMTWTSTSNVFVGYNVSGAVPGANSNTTTDNIEFRPDEPKYVKGGDVLSLITPDSSAYVGLALLAIPG